MTSAANGPTPAPTKSVEPEGVESAETLEASGDASGASRSTRIAPLPRGATVGRYVILDKVGVGGMGVVYAAYDPELDRKLALKLLSTAEAGSRRQHRLLREAQAMARLSHPNVITVHDVGTVDERVFVAMEFIAGGTLKQWLHAAERSAAEVFEVFRQAGRGLAAAHAAGLVHRDFKPDNVMLAKGSRVVVMDFGLARAAATEALGDATEPDAGDSAIATARADELPLSATVTAAGAVIGTPAYMAPEQHEGMAADPRSDQFAFCVALYEALYGQRPFKGDDITTLAINVCCGDVIEPPPRSDVPARVRAAILQGLAQAPADRHDSVEALLHVLAPAPTPSRRRWPVAVLALAGTAGLGLYAGLVLDPSAEPCQDAQTRLDRTWSETRAEAIGEAFDHTGLTFAREQWPSVRAAIDGYADTWTSTYVDACEATHVRGEQSAAMLDRRMSCLARRSGELSAMLELLEAADPIAVEHALEAVQRLPDPARCTDHGGIDGEALAPDAAVVDTVASLQERLARVGAMEAAGMDEVGRAAADALAADAHHAGYPPVWAEALLHLAGFERRAGELGPAERHYRQAVSSALRGGVDSLAAAAAVALVDVIGQDETRAREAEGWADLAAALLGRVAEDPDTEARLLTFRASLLRQSGELDEAARALRQALSLSESAHGPGDARVAVASAELADVLVAMGERHEAREMYERALRIDENTIGRDHPRSATILHALGDLSLVAGQFGQALDYHHRALRIREEVFGADAIELADSLRAMGQAYSALGRGAQAADQLARATAIARTHLRAGHPVVASLLVAEADAARRRGDNAVARQRYQAALRWLEVPVDDDALATAGPIAERLARAMGPRADQGPSIADVTRALTELPPAVDADPPAPPED